MKLEKEVADRQRLEESESSLKRELVELKAKLMELLQIIDLDGHDVSYFKPS